MRKNFKHWLIAAFFLTDGLGLSIFGWSRFNSINVLAREGVGTTGKVIDHSTSHYSRRSTSYHLTVEFAPTNSPAITKAVSVDGDTYRTAVKAGTVEVRYLPRHPETCGAGNVAVLPFQVLIVLGVAMILVGLVVSVRGQSHPPVRGLKSPTL